MEFTYDTSGTCSTQIVVDVDENTKKSTASAFAADATATLRAFLRS